MGRYLLTIVIAVCVVAWLVLSYLPAAVVSLPTIAFDGAWIVSWFPVLAGLILATLAAIQVVLLAGTGHVLRQPADAGLRNAIAQFRLRLSAELLLTALPLAMTLGLALLLYLLWR